MLKRYISILLLLALLSAHLSRCFVYAGFEVNKSYIVAELCENKDKPELNCNGKCFLKKKLKAAEEKERKQEIENQRNRFQETLPPKVELPEPIKIAHAKKNYPQSIIKQTIDRSASIFQPPRGV
ncbi:hypothetical protein [Pedobacter flavus]|uniref:Secreted protein n=1 Tax=Pedobacter flavus TaxID=3113906 RepID=A0ABU7GYJ9_9SPHI|nr:hypothetical protein [Pedobacter sp. VNH31]MEE1884119.1 hypothetical protein [Pedobacter sp. VNH31]